MSKHLIFKFFIGTIINVSYNVEFVPKVYVIIRNTVSCFAHQWKGLLISLEST
jgi:hypothetical protein